MNVLCPKCDGDGSIDCRDGSSLTCPQCEGLGRVEATEIEGQEPLF